jgi:hypothetical protein
MGAGRRRVPARAAGLGLPIGVSPGGGAWGLVVWYAVLYDARTENANLREAISIMASLFWLCRDQGSLAKVRPDLGWFRMY